MGKMDGTATRLLDGRYRIGALLGEGATGTVSCAYDELLGRTVAIKLLKPAYGGDSAFVERFYAEARAAARIVDPRVVGIYDLISGDRTHAIVMEYVDGPSIAQALARDGRFVESRSIDLARQIAHALAAAHAQGMVHRDLKPANVLTNARGLVKVTDFGLARAFGASALTIGTPGALVGSVHYLSPEQARGQALTPASDLYSLGIMLYRFQFGRVPFEGDSPIAIALAHIDEPAPSFARLCEAMSSDLARIVERLLSKDPLERFASANALDDALAEIEVSRTSVRSSARYDTDAPTLLGTISALPREPVAAAISPAPSPDASVAATEAVARGAPLLTRSHVARRRVAATLAASFAHVAALVSSVAARTSDGWTKLRSKSGVGTFARSTIARSRRLLRRHARPFAVGAILVLAFGAVVAATRPQPITLADLRHRPLDNARAALVRDGLRADVVSRPDETLAAGRIVTQKPAPGAALHAGDRVTLVVSAGPPTLAIPNLVGSSFATAVARLKGVRLRVRYAAAFSSAPANDVIEEVPPAGTRVRLNSNAIVVISTGARPTVRYSTNSGGGDGGD